MNQRVPPSGQEAPWWQGRAFLALLVGLSIVPLLYPPIPPLVDLPGHMGRYQVQLMGDASPSLSAFYSFDWQLIGNLGVDLLVELIAPVFGLELAVKLIVIVIPALTVLGMIWIAREVHGRVPPTVLFALPLAYGHPFHFGFVNFALSMALALNAFALWLRLARLGRFRLRAVLFVPLSMLLWVTHTYGWGTLGVMAFSAEVVRIHDSGRAWHRSLVPAGIQCLPLAPPVLLMALWRGGQHVGGQTGDWFNWDAKALWIEMTLRDRWRWFDIATLGVMLLVIAAAPFSRRLGFSRNLAASALVLLAVFLLLPRVVFGSAYADMRLTPFMIAVMLVAIRPGDAAGRRFLGGLAAAGLAFFLVRTAATTTSLALASDRYDRALDALDHVPHGARLVTFVGHGCGLPWFSPRTEHLGAMAIVRREAFSNDQWAMAGAQLLGVRDIGAPGFDRDPSELVTARDCPGEEWHTIDHALTRFPRTAFDYVWLIGPPHIRPEWVRGLLLIWTNGRDRLYRAAHSLPLQDQRS
ncbi:hypothetical protein [Sphingomonas flavalba]|uniref:hypothetical protein n=1 Tax=Sphingomonas flavalba TaxID=2559804 RepID=UPI00109DD08C|nr:hypothetical protein [Sphingomonas flavalba]